ncbi:MAG: DUF2029 domain-containing protein [Phycisphaera sp.]|nr:DUF2029 domain-containing protein [Phycisphaera sp.]
MRARAFHICGLTLVLLCAAIAWVVPFQEQITRGSSLFTFVPIYIVASVVYLLAARDMGQPSGKARWVLIIGVGVAMRIAMITAPPILEDDYHRYLWDGAVTAHGHNPWLVAPNEVETAVVFRLERGAAHHTNIPDDLIAAAHAHTRTIANINHGHLRTVYPPVAQAAFAAAYALSPFSVGAWRAVLLLFDAATLVLIVALLRRLNRPTAWAALYWWCPLVVIEVINRCHMDVIAFPFVVGAVLLTLRRRHVWAMAVLGLAIGAKLWPLVLAPLLLRPLLGEPRRLIAPVAVLAIVGLPMVLATLSGGIDSQTGLIAYGKSWSNNSALHEAGLMVFRLFGGTSGMPGYAYGVTRGLMALGTLGLIGFLACWPLRDAGDLCGRCVWTVAGVFLLSPTQFPWYWLWALPLLTTRPLRWALLYAALLPLYHLNERLGMTWVVWAEHIPVAIVMLIEFRGLLPELARRAELDESASEQEVV